MSLSTSSVYFSPGDDCLNAIIKTIQTSQYTLDICVFTISDNRIAKSILAAHHQKIKIRIITDNEKCLDKGSDIKELAEAGISVKIDKSPNHMHHKFAISDHNTLITGSYNWTRSAALYNHENIIVVSLPYMANLFTAEFEKLWDLCANF